MIFDNPLLYSFFAFLIFLIYIIILLKFYLLLNTKKTIHLYKYYILSISKYLILSKILHRIIISISVINTYLLLLLQK